MSLPNPNLSFSPFAILTAEELNDLVDNIEALADGSGLDDGSIQASKLVIDATEFGYLTIGRTTLSSAGNTLAVSGLPEFDFLRVIIRGRATGGTVNASIRFNNDSGTRYAARYMVNYGGTAGTLVNGTSLPFEQSTTVNNGMFYSVIEISNLSGVEKLFTMRTINHETGTGAGNIPGFIDMAGKYANTSGRITSVNLTNSDGSGSIASGSTMIVLGKN